MLHTKEFYDVMNVFERTSSKIIRTGNMGFIREPKENWIRQLYYSDGIANQSFLIFLSGYSLGKSYGN